MVIVYMTGIVSRISYKYCNGVCVYKTGIMLILPYGNGVGVYMAGIVSILSYCNVVCFYRARIV